MIIALGSIIALIGFGLRYFLNRRAFNRRNMAGLQEFSSFESATATRFVEGIGRLISLVFIIAGLLILLVGYMGNR